MMPEIHGTKAVTLVKNEYVVVLVMPTDTTPRRYQARSCALGKAIPPPLSPGATEVSASSAPPLLILPENQWRPLLSEPLRTVDEAHAVLVRQPVEYGQLVVNELLAHVSTHERQPREAQGLACFQISVAEPYDLSIEVDYKRVVCTRL